MNTIKALLMGLCLISAVSCVSKAPAPTPDTPPATTQNNPAPPADSGNMRVCTMDVKVCPNGSYVSRDASKGCAFAACP